MTKKSLRPYQQNVFDLLKKRLKETDLPLLVNASVGSGKSVIIAELLLYIERAGYRALCLTMNSTLIRQNADTYIGQGGRAGIYCAGLGEKDASNPVIFGSPMSVRMSIKKNEPFSKIPFNLIVVDECHNINVNDKSTTYMRIFNHYAMLAQAKGHKIRFVGLTGTPYRGKGVSIVGEKQFFKEEVCSIPAEWLIKQEYLANPVWGYLDKQLKYDFENIKVNSMGRFNGKDLEEVIDKTPRLTAKIMSEVVEVVSKRMGAFIFASSIKHCDECAEWLPANETAVITGTTPDNLREEYITKARQGVIKYLVNVNVLCTGVDVPSFDTVVFVRPTESLVLYMQCLGRGLRLFPGKKNCLILDYAGNLDRHGDIDNPIINKALNEFDKNNPDYCIQCFNCNTLNTVHARRCIGQKDDKRCDHWFEFKECPGCLTKNDIVSRQCRSCFIELLDPNRNLKEQASHKEKLCFQVRKTTFSVAMMNGYPKFTINYIFNRQTTGTKHTQTTESFFLSSDKSVRYFYHTIVKQHFYHPHQAFTRLQNIQFLKSILDKGEIYCPESIECVESEGGQLRIVSKNFRHNTENADEITLDVLYTFFNICSISKSLVFEYLVKMPNDFMLIEDKYKIHLPTSYKRFCRNYGSNIGSDINEISSNQRDIRFPTKIIVNEDYKFKKIDLESQRLDRNDNNIRMCSRTNLNMAYEQWIKIVRFEVFNEYNPKEAVTRDGVKFKVYRLHMNGYLERTNNYGEKEDLLINVSCEISHNDLEKVKRKIYTHFIVIADGRHSEDVETWKDLDGHEFKKEPCFDWKC